VDTGFEQLPHRDGRHGGGPPVRFVPPRTSSPGSDPSAGAGGSEPSRRVSGSAPSRSEQSACDLRHRS